MQLSTIGQVADRLAVSSATMTVGNSLLEAKFELSQDKKTGWND